MAEIEPELNLKEVGEPLTKDELLDACITHRNARELALYNNAPEVAERQTDLLNQAAKKLWDEHEVLPGGFYKIIDTYAGPEKVERLK